MNARKFSNSVIDIASSIYNFDPGPVSGGSRSVTWKDAMKMAIKMIELLQKERKQIEAPFEGPVD